MNWKYRIDPASGTLLVRADGLVTGDELLRGAVALANDVGFGDSARVLLDYTRVTEWAATTEDMALLSRHPRYSAGTRCAVIVPFGLSQGLFGSWAEKAMPGTAGVFLVIQEAVTWLNVGRTAGAHLSLETVTGA